MTTKEDKVSALVNQSVSPSIISDSTCASSPSRYYHRPTDSVTSKNGALVMDDGEEGTEVQNIELQDMPRAGSPRKQTVPVDLDDGGFLEPEINLRAIHDMAAEHMAHGEYEEAVEVFEEILRGQKERYGGNHYRVGTALHNLSIAYRKIENIEQAIEYCEQAVEVRKEALLPDHPDVALSLAQLGVSFLEVERIGEALVSFREALHISRNALGPKHIKCSKILNNIGCALYTNDELEESRSAFAEALDIYRYSLNHVDDTQEASKSNSHSNNLMMSMASTLCNIGSIELRYGQLDEAEIALDEALLVR
jgi:tetratricopeptide (TPR) repeat protein